MGRSQMVIPIVQSDSACSTGDSCASSATCGSTSCSSAGALDSNDPAFLLAQQGWILRTTIGEPRLSEVVENYKAMGYEVHVERFGTSTSGATTSDGGESCTACYDAADRTQASQVWGSVYVRPGQSPDKNDELFG